MFINFSMNQKTQLAMLLTCIWSTWFESRLEHCISSLWIFMVFLSPEKNNSTHFNLDHDWFLPHSFLFIFHHHLITWCYPVCVQDNFTMLEMYMNDEDNEYISMNRSKHKKELTLPQFVDVCRCSKVKARCRLSSLYYRRWHAPRHRPSASFSVVKLLAALC